MGKNVSSKLLAFGLAVALAAITIPAMAQSRGDWTIGAGVGWVIPSSDNGTLGKSLKPDVSNAVRPTITFEYFVYDNLGIEILAAWPFKHDISIDGLGEVGSTKQLPPTVSLQYHFNSQGTISPFIGVGVNYTTFFSEDTKAALSHKDLDLDDSWGIAGHIGVDVALTPHSALRIDARYMDIDTEVELNGKNLGTVHIDPMVWGISYIWKF